MLITEETVFPDYAILWFHFVILKKLLYFSETNIYKYSFSDLLQDVIQTHKHCLQIKNCMKPYSYQKIAQSSMTSALLSFYRKKQ